MAHDQLFKELCKPEIMRVGWHLAQADSRDDFVTDPIGHADFASNLDHRLQHLVEQVQTHRYRPRYLLEVDIPKSGLSVRPGNVLPIEEASLLHAIVYLLAPLLDKQLDKAVYSYRLHPDWKKRIKKPASLFRESDIEFPFLKRSTIRIYQPIRSLVRVMARFRGGGHQGLHRRKIHAPHKDRHCGLFRKHRPAASGESDQVTSQTGGG